MERTNRTRMSAFLGGLLLTLSQAGNAVTIAETPLFISTGVTPNVMLIVDNSGSMESIIWAKGYDSTHIYPDWSPMQLTTTGGTNPCSNGTGYAEGWDSLTSSVTHSTLINTRYRGACAGKTPPNPGSCAANFTRGVSPNGLTTKCLKLPSPAGGNTRYAGNYLNYLFDTYAGGTDLTTGLIPNDYRMNVAKNVATNVVNDNTNLRMGLMAFNTDQGGRVLQACNTGNTAALNTSIAGLVATTWTPLAEALYEATRYFRGMSSHYNNGVSYTSPIRYRCQKNFAIVITDGYPTKDTSFPTNDPADLADPARSLPNWDNLNPPTTASMYPNFPTGSDGFQPSGSSNDEGYTLYLDDLAKFAYDIDMRTGPDDTHVSFDDPPFQQQNLITYTVGFAVANQMMADAAANGSGLYFQAGDEEELTAALQAAMADIHARTSGATSVATNSTRLASDTLVYQARFSSSDWGGQLLAYPVGAGGKLATLDANGIPQLDGISGWNAAKMVPVPASRNIMTYNPAAGTGMAFEWTSLTAAQQLALNTDLIGNDDGQGQKRLNYLRGDKSDESPNGMAFRVRSSPLGDIINSDLSFVSTQNYGFDQLTGSEGSSYRSFRQSGAYKGRTPMVYVAANDGMLHGFNAKTGVELLAFMPNAVYPELKYIADPSFNTNHRMINDGAPRALDAYIGGSWKTVLLGTLGRGGKGVYALDVTTPDSFGASDVMWEFTSADDSNMGVAIPQATIARMYNGKWVAIVPNGYNSGGNAVLFILDLETGAKLKEFDTGVGGDNGLSATMPVDVDGDRITDYIYAGDLKGNMWKFDVTGSSTSDWHIAFSGAPLYTACSADPCTPSNRQPITAPPEVGISPPEGYFVYFGTGRYFAVGDNGTGTGANTVYAIRDKNEKGASVEVLPTAGRSKLVHQSVLNEQVRVFGAYQEGVRVTTDKPITDAHDGWYLDLPTSGERQVSSPILRGGRLIFTTIIPSGDECTAGGRSWLMEIDALSGSKLKESPFDLNRDRSFDIKDMVPLDPNDPNSAFGATSGVMLTQGLSGSSGFLGEGGGNGPGPGLEYKLTPGTGGGMDVTIESISSQRGRQSWREIQ